MTSPRRVLPALLDVNVLVALAWPNHVGHTAARAWFDAESSSGWATTPVTESGFVRVSSNRRALPTTTTPGRAVRMLGRLAALPGHVFWEDALHLVTGDRLEPDTISGYRQVTAAHLVAWCRVHAGRLVTFDRAIVALTTDDPDAVHVLEATSDVRP